jgi:hypothetical protein
VSGNIVIKVDDCIVELVVNVFVIVVILDEVVEAMDVVVVLNKFWIELEKIIDVVLGVGVVVVDVVCCLVVSTLTLQ